MDTHSLFSAPIRRDHLVPSVLLKIGFEKVFTDNMTSSAVLTESSPSLRKRKDDLKIY